MKQGDLVRRIDFPEYMQDNDRVRELWGSPALIIRGIYEGTITHYNNAGRPTMTELKPCVDVVISGSIIKRVPIEILERIIPGEKKDEGLDRG